MRGYMKKKKDIPNTPEEKAHAEKRDFIMKERPQEWDHIQKERQKIRGSVDEQCSSRLGHAYAS